VSADPAGLLDDVPLTLEAVLAETTVPLDVLAGARPGMVILTNQPVEEPVRVYLQGQLVAEGEVVLVGDQFAVRILRLLDGGSAAAGS